MEGKELQCDVMRSQNGSQIIEEESARGMHLLKIAGDRMGVSTTPQLGRAANSGSVKFQNLRVDVAHGVQYDTSCFGFIKEEGAISAQMLRIEAVCIFRSISEGLAGYSAEDGACMVTLCPACGSWL